MTAIARDLRHALKSLRRTPQFTAATIVMLALAIGANTAIFIVVHTLRWKPLPYPRANELAAVVVDRAGGRSELYWSYPVFSTFRQSQQSFSEVAAYGPWPTDIVTGSAGAQVDAEIVTGNYFAMLGLKPVIGRLLTPADDRSPDAHPVVVLSDSLWHRMYGGDPGVLGRSISIKGRALTIVGVMSREFRGQGGKTSLWIPTMMAPSLLFREVLAQPQGARQLWLKVIGRVENGIAEAQPSDAFQVPPTGGVLRSQMSLASGGTSIVPLRDARVDPVISRTFTVLWGAILIVLLIACANTAVLMCARTRDRQRSLAVQMSLGASRAVVCRQVLFEAIILGLVAGGFALFVAYWGLGLLRGAESWNATGFWSQYALTFEYFTFEVGPAILAFNLLMAVVVGVAFGIVPAWRAARLAPNEVLRAAADVSPRVGRARRLPGSGTLLLVQLSLSVVLLVAAAMSLRSLARATDVPLGFEPVGIGTISLSASDRHGLMYYEGLLQDVRALAGIKEAVLSTRVPLTGALLEAVSVDRTDDGRTTQALLNVVTPGFFRTYGVNLLSGREFDEKDRIGAVPVAVVSTSMARQSWPGEDPIGKHVRTGYRIRDGNPDGWFRVVGVVADVKYGTLETPAEPALYLSAWQPLGSSSSVTRAPDVVSFRTTGAPEGALKFLQRELQAKRGALPVREANTMAAKASALTSHYRYSSALLAMLGCLALVLTMWGLYSVASWSVASRSRELAIRMALGGNATHVLLVAVGSLIPAIGIGVISGVLAARAMAQVLASVLFGMAAADVSTLAPAGITVAAIASLTIYTSTRWIVQRESITSLLR